MSFRRVPDLTPENSRWRCANHGVLTECGIPDDVASNDRRWRYVLLHGNDALHSGWDASWISAKQACRLLKLLLCDLESEIGVDLIRELRGRCIPKGTVVDRFTADDEKP